MKLSLRVVSSREKGRAERLFFPNNEKTIFFFKLAHDRLGKVYESVLSFDLEISFFNLIDACIQPS